MDFRRLPQSDPDSDAQPPNKRAKVEDPDAISGDEESEEETPAVRVNHLNHSDMGRITNGQWLNDVVIHAAHQK